MYIICKAFNVTFISLADLIYKCSQVIERQADFRRRPTFSILFYYISIGRQFTFISVLPDNRLRCSDLQTRSLDKSIFCTTSLALQLVITAIKLIRVIIPATICSVTLSTWTTWWRRRSPIRLRYIFSASRAISLYLGLFGFTGLSHPTQSGNWKKL